jgi:hypothetical protein
MDNHMPETAMQILTAIALTALLGTTTVAYTQTSHTGHDAQMQSGQSATFVLTEPSQGAFAALSEVVRVLEADPNTDWSRVDLKGLRAHLLDMDRLVSEATATETHLPDGVKVVATGDAETVATLQRMVPAHAAQLAKDARWDVSAELTDDGVELVVTSDDPSVALRIKGLGFFGLMASQDHHRAHHLLIARGENVHGH